MVIGRLLESHGFRVGIISQPDWHSKDDFMQLGEPNLYFGVTAGNMDSMINRLLNCNDCEKTALANGLRYHIEDRVMIDKNKTIVFA